MNNHIDKKSSAVYEQIQQSLIKNLSHSIEVFFPLAHDVLFEHADKAKNNAEQIRFFDSISTLNNVKLPLKNKFIQLIKNQLDLCFNNESDKHSNSAIDELDLIDLNEFEHRLAINNIVVKLSPHYEQELHEIELRMGELLANNSAGKIELDPFSPGVIFNCFSEAVYEYFIGNDIILLLIHQFEKVMDNHFVEIFKEINKIFINNNILPIIEKKKLKIVKAPSENNLSADNTLKNNLSADKLIPTLEVKQQQQQQQQSQTSSEKKRPASEQSPSVDINTQHMTEASTLHNNINLAPGYQTLKELFTYQSGHKLNVVPIEFYDSEDYKRQLNALVDELSLLQIEQSKDAAKGKLVPLDLKLLVSKLQENFNNEVYCIELYNEFQHGINIVERLFNFIDDEQWLDKPAKKLLLLLKLPLLKVSLLHKDFFESWSNPVRIVINKLAMLEFYDESNPFFQKVLSAIIDILENYQTDLNIFAELQKLLTRLLEMQSQYYDKKINIIIKKRDAQQAVSKELASRLAGKNVPVIISDFISHQWLPVLVACYLEKGIDSTQWSQYLQALDLLILTMIGEVNEDFIEHDVILYIIKQGLEECALFDKKIINDIRTFLLEGDKGNELNLSYELIFKLLIGGNILSDETAIESISKGMTDARFKVNSSLAKRLSVHSYVQYKKNNLTTKLQYVWKSDNQHLFVFATTGAKEQISFNLFEVVSLLDSGQLNPIKDYDLPLLERSLYAILGDVHDDLARQSCIDKVTGLMVRNEFERVFRKYLEEIASSAPDCALCLINIDKFALINNTCGFKAGDKYLAEIAELIKQSISSEVTAARYGTDEFILLLPHQDEEGASAFAELLRQHIYNHNFHWEEKSFSLSASIGLLVIPEIKNIEIFMKSVVSAVDLAKQYGRNRVHILKYDDLALNYHQELQLWATKIDDMINNNQLDIRCQRLHPIDNENLTPHYEMLLLVKDESGKTTPPTQFIEAAELYNKMVDVDRWVVQSVFQWFSEHPELLDKMGGVAINLSGQSMNDVDFLQFIQLMFNQYPIPPKRICFEITETVAIINMNFAINMIHSIRELGCEFSLDDFGTGQSSYAYLKNLPVDYLKIDGVFVKDIVSSPADQAMVKSINEIGHFLGMKTVAEFVENNDIMEVLKQIGVDYAQGYGVETPFLMKEVV